MNQTKRCECELCEKMKNPKPVHREQTQMDGFTCHFLIVRDGRTQNYAASMLVEVGNGKAVHTCSEFTMARGTPQEDAISDIIHAAVEQGVLEDLLVGAREAWREDVNSTDTMVEEIKQDLTRMFQQAAQRGVTPGEALRARLAEMREEAEREMMREVAQEMAQDPFRPVGPKGKTYLN